MQVQERPYTMELAVDGGWNEVSILIVGKERTISEIKFNICLDKSLIPHQKNKVRSKLIDDVADALVNSPLFDGSFQRLYSPFKLCHQSRSGSVRFGVR